MPHGAEIAGILHRLIVDIGRWITLLLAAFAQASIFVAEIVVDHRDTLAAAVGQLADGML